MIYKAALSLEETYELILNSIPGDSRIDSFDVVKQVEQYRQFWRPEKTSVVLLAESHVYTDEQDYQMICDQSITHRVIPDYPLRFVRFVYCLGYGESELVTGSRPDGKNSGTPQYWKIFSSCVADDENELRFRRVLKSGTPSLTLRLSNKADVLKRMKKRGLWLLDASIVGLYGSGQRRHVVTEKIMTICWQNFMARMILKSNPKEIIVIGVGVGNILNSQLKRLNVPFTVIPQPQARGDSQWQIENYKKYQRICSKYV
jgi:hypothetical protein